MLSYDYWVNRFARDPGVVGKKILVNNYPMTIVGVSAAGFAGLDPAQVAADPRADPDEAGDGAGLGAGCTWTTGAPAGCRCSRRLKPGYTVESAQAPLQGLFTQIRAVRDDAAGGEGLVAVLARAVHEGHAARRDGGDGLLAACATTSRPRWSC